jgi:asparagine synthase (glutamine-hydrolysing)
MSALAGLWNFDGRPGAEQDCARMLARQALYGPHDTAIWNDDSIALGRNLFRILPEDRYDAQPASGADGRFVLVADIRLDNREELCGALSIAPDRAAALADSAVLCAAWERWGERCLDRLLGDYVFAVWDAKDRRLVLVRDPLGARPLHFHRGASFIAFASMPKGLHALSAIPRAPDEETIAEHLAWLPESGPRTYFANVSRVEPGCIVTVTAAGQTSRRFWQPARTRLKLRDAGAYADALREQLDRAVKVRLRGAGTAVGAHLSAGFDSSTVTTSAAIAMAAQNGKVVAFTSVPREGYDGAAPNGRFGDEGPLAAKTAARYPNIEHVLIRNPGYAPLAARDREFELFDRPVLNLCTAVRQEAINDAAKARQLSVMLTGAAGNMTISYDGLVLLPDLLGRGKLLRWMREGRAMVRSGAMPWSTVLRLTLGAYLPAPLWRRLVRARGRHIHAMQAQSALRPGRATELDIEGRATARGADPSGRPRRDSFASRLWVLRATDTGNLNKGTLAGWGIDLRDPTADRRLVEFCLSVPEEQFLVNGEPKVLGRRAFGARLPPEIADGTARGYQGVDWHEDLTAAHTNLGEELARFREFGPAARALDLDRLQRMVHAWPNGNWNTDETVLTPYRMALQRAMSAGHFLWRASGHSG